ncbi:MAG: AAA family ATPase [Deltaproteobacteria bacterium]|nr:AAA family ATPase [Deltaproteobacteria bacterium]
MKILKLRLKNLNSLIGEHEIDFTHPAITSEGIFLITGPTGSGKTTILDAMTLALYALTPRLKTINKNDNEIMTRRTLDCKAEVEFETQEGRFLAQWSQGRAYNKIDGELKDAIHSLSYWDEKKPGFQILANGISKTPLAVAEVTGLDFAQFKRSTLLPQGDFASFLEARPADRSPLLEQMTDTFIYSEISILSHRRWAEINKNLEALRSKLGGLSILEPGEEESLRLELNEVNEKIRGFDAQITELTNSLAWLERIGTLKNEVNELTAKGHDLTAREEAFKPLKAKLERALTVMALSGDHSTLIGKRQERDRYHAQLEEVKAQLPGLVTLAEKAERELAIQAEAYQKAQRDRLEKGKVITQARELTVKIKETTTRQKKADSVVSEITANGKSLAESKKKNLAEKDKLNGELQDVSERLRRGEGDEALTGRLPALREKAQANRKIKESLDLKTKEAKDLAESIETLEEKIRVQEIGLKKIKAQSERAQKERIELKNKIAGKLQGRLINDLLDEQDAHDETILASKDLQNVLTQLKSATGEVEQLTQASAQNDEQLAEARQLVQKAEVELETAESELQALEAASQKQRTAESLSDLRETLTSGQPCPLCGSTDHPYLKEGLLPKPEVGLPDLSEAKKKAKNANKSAEKLKIALAKLEADHEQLKRQLTKAQDALGGIKAKYPIFLERAYAAVRESKLTGFEDKNYLADHLDKVMAQCEKLLAIVRATGIKVLEYQGSVADLNAKMEEIDLELVSMEITLQRSKHDKDSDQRLFEITNKEKEALAAEVQEIYEAFAAEMGSYGIDKSRLDESFEILEARLKARENDKARLAKLENKLASVEATIVSNDENIKELRTNYAKAANEQTEVQNELTALIAEKKELCGEKEPGDLEAEGDRILKAAENLYEKAKKTRDGADSNLKLKSESQTTLAKFLTGSENELTGLEALFAKKLESFGLASEGEYLSAALPGQERQDLTQKAEKLRDERVALLKYQEEKNKELEGELSKNLTRESAGALKSALEGISAEKPNLMDRFGQLSGRIMENEGLKATHEETQKELEKAEKNGLIWKELDGLIGSSDGKVYRNYVQILTFDCLIDLANERLERMSDRYKLYHDRKNALEIMVIDNYQASEIRPTKNLSGGEKFIVSLALALGLSKMAGEKVRVDSLFLDEGFGTLDADALDMALDTLSSLRQDGKMIGLISHVSALTERVGAKIEVIPVSAGRSVISGPGCRQIN